jgi:hypothetical protein
MNLIRDSSSSKAFSICFTVSTVCAFTKGLPDLSPAPFDLSEARYKVVPLFNPSAAFQKFTGPAIEYLMPAIS